MSHVLTDMADTKAVATTWLADFEQAVENEDPDALAACFRPDGSWRDVLALTGSLLTADGPAAVAANFTQGLKAPRSHRLQIVGEPRSQLVTLYGMSVIEVFFAFTMDVGDGEGIVRLIPSSEDPSEFQALVLLTALQSLRGVHHARPDGPGYATESEDNWLDLRQKEIAFADREPSVLVIGAGQAGLSVAAWLKEFGVDTLMIDKWPRVGDNWRSRYHVLKLHNETVVNHLPFIPFPDSFPRYLPKDKVGNWFEFYADAMELNVWTSTTFQSGTYDNESARWEVVVDRQGVSRKLRPKHVVMAIGVSGIAQIPRMEGIEKFTGPVLHTSQYEDGSSFAGKRVLVVGTGTSGHDVAQDLYRHGAQVTMMQRSKTVVTSCEPGVLKYQELYLSGRPTSECDLIAMSATYPMSRRWLPVLNKQIAELDKELLAGLNAVGFQTHYGEGDMGLSYEYRRRGGGYYIDVGCSRLLIDGKIALVHAQDVDEFTAEGLALGNGGSLPFDAVILATGYKPMQEAVRNMFGSEMADRVGPVWGLDPHGELNNICRRTPQEGLWFLAGGFPETRIYSRHLALQIAAATNGVRL